MLHGNQQDNMKGVIDLIDSVDTLKNLIIGSMNVGFEIHSKRNISMTVDWLNIYYK
jgi:hypothetical protein